VVLARPLNSGVRRPIMRRRICWTAPLLFAGVLSAMAQQPSHPPVAGFVPTAAVATTIAVAVWGPIYGAKLIADEKPYVAVLKHNIWYVRGSLPAGALGGVAEARISKVDGRILSVTHGQ